MESNTPSQVLPEFVWLLHDVDCVPTSADGNELSPTDYLTLVLQKNKSCSTSSTLLQHFPTFRCFTIPPPSADGNILADIFANLEKLTPFFNKEVDGTIQWLLDNVRAKVVGSSGIECDGKMLACLLEQYFAQIHKHSGEIPNFQVSWLKAIELRLMKLADSLVSEYDRDMQAALDGKLPMVEGTNGEAGETLVNIHLQVYAKKRLQYQKELLPFNFLEGTDLLSYLDKNIAEYVIEGGHDKIIGGRLFKFVQANIKSSEKYCATVYHEKYNKIVRPAVENALTAGIPTTFDEEFTKFVYYYYEFAKGPAIDYMYEELRTESIGFEAELSQIPGPVQSLRVVGASSDRVKLRWNRPQVNAGAATKYVVMIKSKGKDWDEVGIRNGFSALVTGLQGSTWYCFMVLAKSKKYTGRQALIVKVKTGISETANKALRTTAMVASPIALPCMSAYITFQGFSKGIKYKSRPLLKTGLRNLIVTPIAPLAGILPGAGQLNCYKYYNIATKVSNLGSDTCSTDTEVLQWKCKTESTQSDVSQANSQSETPQCNAGSETTPPRKDQPLRQRMRVK